MNAMIRKFFLALVLAAVVLSSACFSGEKTASEPNTVKAEIVEPEPEEPVPSAPPADRSVYDGVEQKIAQCLNDGTEYAVFLAYPQKSTETFIHNSTQMRAASMIKVFIMATVMEKVKLGEISLDEVLTMDYNNMVGGAGVIAGYGAGATFKLRSVLEHMITYSDNTATNMIIDRIGMATVNEYLQRNGYTDTFLGRKMMEYAGQDNYSSVRDLGNFFLRLYHYDCLGEEYDKIMLDFLVKQTDTDCFPAALPGVQIAHKTGALDGLYDDGGIIYSPKGHAILVIMTENYTGGEYNTIQHMKAFTRAVIK